MHMTHAYPEQFTPWNPGMRVINGMNEWLDIRKEVEQHGTSWGWIGRKLHLNLQIKEDAWKAGIIANRCIKEMML